MGNLKNKRKPVFASHFLSTTSPLVDEGVHVNEVDEVLEEEEPKFNEGGTHESILDNEVGVFSYNSLTSL